MTSKITLEFDNVMGALKKEIQDVLVESEEEFKKAISDQAHSDVYGAYSSKYYSPRMDAGGLSSTDNYEITEGDLSLTLRNRTESGTDYWKYKYSIETTDVVENGSGHGWKGVPARPFMEKGLERFAYDILEPKLNKLGGR